MANFWVRTVGKLSYIFYYKCESGLWLSFGGPGSDIAPPKNSPGATHTLLVVYCTAVAFIICYTSVMLQHQWI